MYLTRYTLNPLERAGAGMLALGIPASIAFALMLSWPAQPQGSDGGEALTLINLSSHSDNSPPQMADDSPDRRSVDERHLPGQQKAVATAAPPTPARPKKIFVASQVVSIEWQPESAAVSSSVSATGSANGDPADSALSSGAGSLAAPAMGGPAAKDRPVRDSYGRLVFARIRAAQRYERVLERDSIAGTVTVTFKINRRGHLRAPRIAVSSGNKLLDLVAIRHLAAAAPFPRPPHGRERSFIIPLTYRQSE
jgi:TonB family protein